MAKQRKKTYKQIADQMARIAYKAALDQRDSENANHRAVQAIWAVGNIVKNKYNGAKDKEQIKHKARRPALRANDDAWDAIHNSNGSTLSKTANKLSRALSHG